MIVNQNLDFDAKRYGDLEARRRLFVVGPRKEWHEEEATMLAARLR